jgi:hypothetical protein
MTGNQSIHTNREIAFFLRSSVSMADFYTIFPDSDRSDSFPIPPAYYLPNEILHRPAETEDFDRSSSHVADGTLPPETIMRAYKLPIKLARHHIISWKILRKAWNRAVRTQLNTICAILVRMLTETGGRVMPEAGAICWAKRNLIVGPLGNERLFDPGDSLDFESPIAMKGRRKVHVAAMVELGKLMQAFGDDKIEPKEFSVKFMKMHRHCLRVPGEEICVFQRDEWTLMSPPDVAWLKNPWIVGKWLTINTPAPLWHRGSYSPAKAERYYAPNASVSERRTKTAILKRRTHTRFVRQLGEDPRGALWKFIT